MVRGRYRGYRGKDSRWNGKRIALIAVIAVVVLAVVGLLACQRYIVYADDGIRLELPFFRHESDRDIDKNASPDIVHQSEPIQINP